MAKQTASRFLELVRRSKLVDAEQLDRAVAELLEELGAEALDSTDAVAARLIREGLLSRWQCDQIRQGRYKGFFLKKYKLLDHLGTGGMSSVYLAEHTLMQRRVAIKILPQRRVDDASYLARFYREAQAAAALDHPNIVRAYDVDHEENIHFLVMEYVQGYDLATLVKEQGPLPYHTAAEYIRQAAVGLAHAHGAGLIHRDVKPGNLLVDRNHVVKLLDLGLARFASDEGLASLTIAHEENVLGTADYLAPEQAIDSHRVDARADIYSLGCSFYYLLTGHAPFDQGTLPQRIMAHQRQTPPSILKDRPDAPADLVEICMWMMAKKPEQRPQSAAEVARVLGDWLRAHGFAADSATGLGGSSSGRLAAAVPAGAADTQQGKAAPAGTQRPGSGSQGATRPGRQTSRALHQGSPLPVAKPLEDPAIAAPPSGSSSASGSGLPATAAETADARSPAGGLAPGIPVAAPLEQAHEGLPFILSDDSSVLPHIRAGSTLRGSPYTRRRQDDVPLWVWGIIAGGGVLALILFLVYLLTR